MSAWRSIQLLPLSDIQVWGQKIICPSVGRLVSDPSIHPSMFCQSEGPGASWTFRLKALKKANRSLRQASWALNTLKIKNLNYFFSSTQHTHSLNDASTPSLRTSAHVDPDTITPILTPFIAYTILFILLYTKLRQHCQEAHRHLSGNAAIYAAIHKATESSFQLFKLCSFTPWITAAQRQLFSSQQSHGSFFFSHFIL